ncbi:MAG: DoxX family protein [Candidatus Acidiferrales bacterium]
MHFAYLIITIIFPLLLALSAIGKIRRDQRQLQVIHKTVGVPLEYFPLLAGCELAGAVGLLAGIWWAALGVAAGIGLVLYFVGAIVSHLRVKDFKGIGSAAFMLAIAVVALALRILTYTPGVRV